MVDNIGMALAKACGDSAGGLPGGKLPKAVANLRNVIGDQQPSVDVIKKTLGSSGYNNFCNSFRAQLTHAEKGQYDLSTAEKHEWIEQWAMDPSSCRLKGYNRTTSSAVRETKFKEHWITQAVLGGPAWLNDAGHAAAFVEAGELPSRPSKCKALATQGVLEYMVKEELRAQVSSTGQDAIVEAEAELKPEYDTVKRSMTEQPSERVRKKTAKKTPADTKKATALRQLKKAIDQDFDECRKVMALLPMMIAKGYLASMSAFFQGRRLMPRRLWNQRPVRWRVSTR